VQTGKVKEPDEDCAADLYEFAMTRLAEAGYRQYEVSNWAKVKQAEPPGLMPALASRHNLLYWRNHEYLGIGPGAHSHLRMETATGEVVSKRWGNRKPVPSYVKRIQAGESVEEFSENIDLRMAMGETMMLGLRLLEEGVAFQRFQALHGVALQTIFADELTQLQNKQLIEVDETRVRLTPRGLLLGNQVFAQFLPETENEVK